MLPIKHRSVLTLSFIWFSTVLKQTPHSLTEKAKYSICTLCFQGIVNLTCSCFPPLDENKFKSWPYQLTRTIHRATCTETKKEHQRCIQKIYMRGWGGGEWRNCGRAQETSPRLNDKMSSKESWSILFSQKYRKKGACNLLVSLRINPSLDIPVEEKETKCGGHRVHRNTKCLGRVVQSLIKLTQG